jgi:predicted transcriptional regulator
MVTMSDSELDSSCLEMTAQIVAAHVGHNAIPNDALPDLIQLVYRTLAGVAAGPSAASEQGERPQPAVPIRQSVFPDYIVCLEDGKQLKTMKRHLNSAYGMTPAQYRERWGLPADYPMVAPSYASRRSTLAKSFGLGRPKLTEVEEPIAEPTVTRLRARHAKGSRW